MSEIGGQQAPLRVHITNCVLLNGGDAAIVEATMESLRERLGRPVQFTVFDQQPAVSARRFPELAIRPWPWHAFGGRGLARTAGIARALLAARLIGRGLRVPAGLLLRRRERELLEEYARGDLVISKGGTYLVEQYRLEPHLLDFRVCRALRRRLVLGPQSLGPFRRRVNRVALRRALGGVPVFVRDERSLRNLEDIGLTGQVAADTAFLWAKPQPPAQARAGIFPARPRVAVSVREWHGAGEGYRESMAALVAHLVGRHDATVTFLSTCQGVPEYVTDDSRLAREVVALLPAEVATRVGVSSDWHRPRELQERFGGFDLVVAARMHAAILALNAGVPVLPIAWEFKTTELFGRLGLGDFVQDAETMTPQSALEALDRFLAELPDRRAALFDAVARERESALGAMQQIAAMVEDSVPAPRRQRR